MKLYILDEERLVENEDETVDVPDEQLSEPKRTRPEPLDTFSNKLEICEWLVSHPDILHLADEMLVAKRASLDGATSIIVDHSTSPSEGSRTTSDVTTNVITDVRIISSFL